MQLSDVWMLFVALALTLSLPVSVGAESTSSGQISGRGSSLSAACGNTPVSSVIARSYRKRVTRERKT